MGVHTRIHYELNIKLTLRNWSSSSSFFGKKVATRSSACKTSKVLLKVFPLKPNLNCTVVYNTFWSNLKKKQLTSEVIRSLKASTCQDIIEKSKDQPEIIWDKNVTSIKWPIIGFNSRKTSSAHTSKILITHQIIHKDPWLSMWSSAFIYFAEWWSHESMTQTTLTAVSAQYVDQSANHAPDRCGAHCPPTPRKKKTRKKKYKEKKKKVNSHDQQEPRFQVGKVECCDLNHAPD